MSQQQQDSEPEEKKKKKKKNRRQLLTRAVTHIRLREINPGKLAALDALAEVYMAVCQQYVTLFCTEEQPDAFHASVYETPLSERWQRAVIQQAAGIAQSWRTNRANAYQEYTDALADYYDEQQADPTPERKEPTWKEWSIPALKATCIQANTNVVSLEPSTDSTFDYWLTISTLQPYKTVKVPVKLADYHRDTLTDQTVNTSVTLNKRGETWWLTLTYDETKPTAPAILAPVVGIDVGITNFVTTSTGEHYGSFDKKLRARHKRDRRKRQRKAKLRKCLEKKGVHKLPATSSRTGQRLARHVRQSINRAVNEYFEKHPSAPLAYEHLSVATMRFKARAMNAYLYASNLAHIPQKIAWGALKRGLPATQVKSAYSSQECSVCHYTDKKNRPNQQTFCCQVCSHRANADVNAATNIARRLGDEQLRACTNRNEIKVLLMRRHEHWKTVIGCL